MEIQVNYESHDYGGSNLTIQKEDFLESVIGLNELFEGMEYSAQAFDEMLWNMPGQALWGVLYKYVMTTCQFLRVTHDPREALKEAKAQLAETKKRMSKHMNR